MSILYFITLCETLSVVTRVKLQDQDMKLRILYFVPVFCIIFNTLHISAEHGRIYGGYPINITDAPYMVHITLFSEVFANGSAIGNSCGGTILRKNLILTAGHCE